MSDTLTDSLNSPAGRLAEVLFKKIAKGEDGHELPKIIHDRLGKLVAATGTFGRLARVRLAAETSFLFHHAPKWTEKNVVPMFDWSSPEAAAAWSARKYSNSIGSPELFALTKDPFLELFGRTDVPEEDLDIFSGWLTAIVLANASSNAGYPITPAEARAALRKAGTRVLSSVAHRLAIEMEKAQPNEKLAKWQGIVGPVFLSIWPLDVDLQTSASTFKLVQILLATGNAFPEAAEAIIPFLRSEAPRQHTSVFAISKADDVIYSSSPARLLDLLVAVAGDAPAGSVYGLGKALDRLKGHAPQLAASRKFQRLLALSA
jgi:hypothetical protein